LAAHLLRTSLASNHVPQRANATHIGLVLEHDAEYTILKIADDGCGFNIERIGEKQPELINMRERAHEIMSRQKN